jgi:hypothetical protein
MWRDRHPDYWRDRRLERQMQQAEAEGQVRIHSPPAPAPVAAIPWENAQEAMGLKGTGFLAFLVRLSHRPARATLRQHSAQLERRSSTDGRSDGRSQVSGSPDSATLAASEGP